MKYLIIFMTLKLNVLILMLYKGGVRLNQPQQIRHAHEISSPNLIKIMRYHDFKLEHFLSLIWPSLSSNSTGQSSRLVKLHVESHTKNFLNPFTLSPLSFLLSFSLSMAENARRSCRGENNREEARGSGREVKERKGEDLLLSLTDA